MEAGIHRGLGLSRFFFAVVVEGLRDRMMFADDIVIRQVKKSLKRCKCVRERRAMKVTKCMRVNEKEAGRKVNIQALEILKVDEFKYLESVIQDNGER